MSKSKTSTAIPDEKIRVVIWMLKTGKTKKSCCEYLNITYNTKRLDQIVTDFTEKEKRAEELKAIARSSVLTAEQKSDIAKRYLNGEGITPIAESLYLTAPRIKKILIELSIPLRNRKKSGEAKTEHIIQDLEVRFKKGDIAFSKKRNCKVRIDTVYDEEYVETLSNGYMKAVELHPWKDLKDDQEPREGVHFETYWYLEDGTEVGKRSAVQHNIATIMRYIEETGREYYKTIIDIRDAQGIVEWSYYTCRRDDLYPIKVT